MESKEEESIRFLQENEPEEGYILCFSGGKDSLVLKDLTIKSGVTWTGYYSFTGIDPPEIVSYIRENHSDIKIISAPSFFKNVAKKGPPTRMRRWCCDTQKKNPMKRIPGKIRLQGIRAEESFKRRKRGRISEFRKELHYYPIFHWKEWEIWKYIDKYNLPYCSLYDNLLIHRIGCCICPYQGEKEREFSQKQWPGYWKAYKHALEIYYYSVAEKKKVGKRTQQQEDTFYTHYSTFEEFWNWIGIKNEWKPLPKHGRLKI